MYRYSCCMGNFRQREDSETKLDLAMFTACKHVFQNLQRSEKCPDATGIPIHKLILHFVYMYSTAIAIIKLMLTITVLIIRNYQCYQFEPILICFVCRV